MLLHVLKGRKEVVIDTRRLFSSAFVYDYEDAVYI